MTAAFFKIATMATLGMLVLSPTLAAPKKAEPATAATAAPAGPPNAVQGFSQNRDKPVHIEAKRLEVRDKDKVATFIGTVQVIQGDTEMRCNTLVVFYEQNTDAKPGTGVQAETPGPGGAQRIKKLEAKGSVVVTQADQIATGESALFDMPTNTITMIGKVVVTQGQNVLRGDRLVVDMTTGLSHMESGKSGDGRVQGLFLPGNGSPIPAPGAKPNGSAPHPTPATRPKAIY
ncbi:MAG: LptA/OstA family protein [Pseudolabrys sp.]